MVSLLVVSHDRILEMNANPYSAEAVRGQMEEDSREKWVMELVILQDDNQSQECIDNAFRYAIEQGITPVFEAETQKVMNEGMTEYEEWVREFKRDVDERRQLTTG